MKTDYIYLKHEFRNKEKGGTYAFNKETLE